MRALAYTCMFACVRARSSVKQGCNQRAAQRNAVEDSFYTACDGQQITLELFLHFTCLSHIWSLYCKFEFRFAVAHGGLLLFGFLRVVSSHVVGVFIQLFAPLARAQSKMAAKKRVATRRLGKICVHRMWAKKACVMIQKVHSVKSCLKA